MKNIVTFILGGGKGTRIFPLTKSRSKPAIPIGGKYRIIDVPISNCINSNVLKIFVLTQFNSKSLNHHINNAYRFDHFSKSFVDILPAEQTHETEHWYQGTADAIRRSLKYLDSYPECDKVLILSGDQLYRMDFRDLYRSHMEQQAEVTIATCPVSLDSVSEFGIMKVQEKNGLHRITEFVEKPQDPVIIEDFRLPADIQQKTGFQDPGKQHLASMGIYLFNRDVLYRYLQETEDHDFGKEVIPRLISEREVVPYFFDGYWEDIGTIKAFHRANLDLLGKNPNFKLYEVNSPIYTNPRFLPPACIQGTLSNSIIADGATVLGGTITNSIIGLRSCIAANVNIEDTLIMGADWYESDLEKLNAATNNKIPLGIGEGSIIRNAIIDKNVRIGKNVRITNQNNHQNYDDPNGTYVIKDGIVVIPKGTVIIDNTEV